MTSTLRPKPTIQDIMADLKTSVIMVHGRTTADDIPEGVYYIGAECIHGENPPNDQFAGGVKAMLVNLAGAVADGDLMIGDDNS